MNEYKLYKHQKESIELAKRGNLALFLECGLGKTLTALEIIKFYKLPALVVCPISIIEAAWGEDTRKFAPELSMVSLWSKKPAERIKRLNEQHDIYCCNYEILKLLYNQIAAKKFGLIIIDESSKLKNFKSQITRAVLTFAGIQFRGSPWKTDHVIPHRYVMSGTPAPNDESEYWPQIKFITGMGNKCFHDNFYVFRNTYFNSIPLGLTGQKIFKFRSSLRNEFMTAMKPVVHVVKKKDALDLPEQIHEVRHVILSKPEQDAYNTLKRELVLQYGNETILAKTALVEILKLRQLSSGFAYTDTGVIRTGTSKLIELKTILEEIGTENQVIVWCTFREEVKQLLTELPDSQALWGETKDRETIIKDFQTGKFRILVNQVQSAAHGLTFVNTAYSIYYSSNYSLEMQIQSEQRTHRIGQKKTCVYFHVLAKGTIDEIIYRVIQRKSNLSESILNFLKDEASA